MAVQLPGPLVSPAWLAQHLGVPGLKVVDASWYMPADARDPAGEFEAAHIEGAVFFDIDGIKDLDNPLPHMLPNAPLFAQAMASLGLSNHDAIIVYDGTGVFSAPRAWWSCTGWRPAGLACVRQRHGLGHAFAGANRVQC